MHQSTLKDCLRKCIQSVCQFCKKNEEPLQTFFLVMSIAIVSANLSFLTSMPYMFSEQNFSLILKLSSQNCLFSENSFQKYVAEMNLQLKVLIALCCITLILLPFLLLSQRISKKMNYNKAQIGAKFLLFLTAMCLVGRTNSLTLRLNEVSNCEKDMKKFAYLAGALKGVYAMGWLNFIFIIFIFVFCFDPIPIERQKNQGSKELTEKGQNIFNIPKSKYNIYQKVEPIQSSFSMKKNASSENIYQSDYVKKQNKHLELKLCQNL